MPQSSYRHNAIEISCEKACYLMTLVYSIYVVENIKNLTNLFAVVSSIQQQIQIRNQLTVAVRQNGQWMYAYCEPGV